MTRHRNPHSFAFVSSTLAATLLSIVAAWTVSSIVLDPLPADPSAIQLKQDPPSRHLFRLSPIPPGADWTA